MSRHSMIERAASLPRATTAGIGRYRDATGTAIDFQLGWDELARDTTWIGRVFDDWGLASGQAALLTLAGHEAPWFGPILRSLRARQITVATAETYGWDARRSEMFIELLRPHALVGLTAATVEGLGEQGRDAVMRIPALFCRPDAYLATRDSGRAALMVFVGPALAIECSERSGAHLDSSQWHVEADGGGLRLDAVSERAYRPRQEYLDVGCDVVTAACPCGRPGARLVLR